MKSLQPVLDWLLKGDIAIQLQTRKELLGEPEKRLHSLQRTLEIEGWGKELLSRRNKDGHWGKGSYQPKWTCTHYTLLDLKALGINPENSQCRLGMDLLLKNKQGLDGGINYARTVKYSDICINGMLLNLACYFRLPSSAIKPLVDYLLGWQMADGGWNCEYHKGAVHSSMHTTVNVLEGWAEYLKGDYKYRREAIKDAGNAGIEFMLIHRLFRAHRTGTVMDRKMLLLSFPTRWRYDILRGLELMVNLCRPYDERMDDALEVLMGKKRTDNKWPLQSPHPGCVHFEMEKPRKPSRWNTLRALRVLKYYNMLNYL